MATKRLNLIVPQTDTLEITYELPDADLTEWTFVAPKIRAMPDLTLSDVANPALVTFNAPDESHKAEGTVSFRTPATLAVLPPGNYYFEIVGYRTDDGVDSRNTFQAFKLSVQGSTV